MMFPFVGIMFLLGMALTVFSFVLWIWALIDCLQNEPSTGNEKIVWVIVILLTHWIGALLYLFVRRPQRIRQYGA